MTLDELKAKLPEPFQPWADEYGPVFLKMTAAELKAWLELLIRGDAIKAYKTVLDKMPASELLAEWTKNNADWDSANAANAERMALQKSAATAALRIMLAVALAAAGL